jgi:prepilin-type N-terminal cleavage/methylation domain-containing protein
MTLMTHIRIRLPTPRHCRPATGKRSRGFTLIELMIAMAISLLILLALVGLFVSSSRSNREMAKANSAIENGRFAIQLLQQDLVHAGFWGGHLPQFDDLSARTAPGDVPGAAPDPCALNLADDAYRKNLLGIPVQAFGTLPTGAGCVQTATPTLQRGGTDVLLVRHADTCGLVWDPAAGTAVLDPDGSGNCEAFAAGRPYIQPSFCTAEKNWIVAAATTNSVTLPTNLATPPANVAPSNANGAYVGVSARTTSGPGAGQSRLITAYDGATRNATVAPNWTIVPDPATIPGPPTRLALDYALGIPAINRFPLRQRDCTTPALIRRVVSNLYYISDFPHPERAGEVIPTLVRSELDFAGGALAQQAPVPLIEGIEQFRVELGLDSRMTRCGLNNAVDYTAEPNTVASCNPAAPAGSQSLPTNRGDGAPETFVRCTTATPCTAAQLMDVVAVKLYVLVRSSEPTPGYTDSKSYCLGEPADNGTCPVANTVAAANDGYQRHVFTTSIRLANVAGRRDTP